MPHNPFGVTSSVLTTMFDALEQVHGPRVADAAGMMMLHDALTKAEDVWRGMPQAGPQPMAEQAREAA